ncbi:hypothetical protein [Arthrobacter gallicola]|uniref:hypothetical protein n=1 Tax=Arthrobacter gallicola TaxID=2762225 RepID=UPI00296B14FD|nr:hypothetical protein [Arthrobacter gallicola]
MGVALAAVSLLAVTSCTPQPEPEQVSDPVKLLQNVRVNLSSAAGVESIQGTTISVAADGTSSAQETQYDAAQVLGDLPVRVSVQYRAGDKSGSDLSDLQGHSGPVEIDLTLENLTVKPQLIEYDAAGQLRSETALVGAPLTIAASTTLPGVRPDAVTPASADGTAGTNGVLSSTEDGAAVVQWATVLAPPRSGASTTLRLAAEVQDFKVPSIDVAVQPGLSTDLSAEGVLTGAFSSGTGSEMDLQRRTITLVSEVSTVLTKAGSTITEVRRNLEETSQTLGVRTAGELRDNSQALAATMADLKQQLTVLGTDLETATKATQSTTLSQLQQTVSAVDAMLGDTSAVPPPAPIDGEGCLAQVAKPEQAATTVYGSILTMAAQLDAYATVSADCRDTVAGELRATIGPETPTEEVCAAEADAGTSSVTCSLEGSTLTIEAALLGLVEKGEELVAVLQPQVVENAIRDQSAASAALGEASAALAVILDGAKPTEDYKAALAEVHTAIESARASVAATRDASASARSSINGLHQKLTAIGDTAADARSELTDGPLWDPSLAEQNQRLADDLCKMADGGIPAPGKLSDKDAERLRSYLTAVPCDAADPALKPPFGVQEPLDDRLDAQAAAWDAVLASVDTAAADQQISQAFTALDAAIENIDAKLDVVTETVKALNSAATENVTGTKRGLESLDEKLDAAIDSSAGVGAALTGLKEEQDTLADDLQKALEGVSKATAEEVREAVAEQVRQVAELGEKSSENVVTAFNNSIAGLESTSDGVVGEAKGTVDEQRKDLLGRSSALAGSLSESTEASLANIASGTSGSTRDVEGASALLTSSLNKVMLDLGDRSVNGSGLLGSMTTSAAKAETADYQLALATQNAEGYANIRSRDVAGLLLRQAQFRASLTAVDDLPPFQLRVPDGADSQTLYTLKIGAGA